MWRPNGIPLKYNSTSVEESEGTHTLGVGNRFQHHLGFSRQICSSSVRTIWLIMPGESHKICVIYYSVTHVSWVGSVLCTDPAQPLITAGYGI